MAYFLGIDLGTTYTAAATERDGLVEALTLGNRTASVPSVVFLRDDGEILVGEAATRRASSEPGRVGREFKRRVGDPTPIILGGTPYAAEMLMARLLRWSVDRVQEQQGGPPEAIALTHPANWGPYKLDLLRQAVRQVDVDVALTLPEPVAAATFYASQRSLDPGAVVAVYDLGGGTFDAAMVRRKAVGFELIGTPEGIERLGGIDFDEAVFAHVRNNLGDALDALDPEEMASVAAMGRLRQECIDAKEALSSDTDVSIPVLLPHLQTEVRLTRREFEDMIRPAIGETIVALRRSIRSANVGNEQISAVLLVGGSSRIPLVAQMVGAELGRPIAIDAHPKDAISFGAAIAGAQEKGGKATPESVTTVLPDERPPPPTMADRPAPPATGRPAPPRADPRPAPPPGGPAPLAGTPAAPARPASPTPGQTPTRPGAPTPDGPGAARPAAAGYQPPAAPGNGAPARGAGPAGPAYQPQPPGARAPGDTGTPGAAGPGAGSGTYRQQPPGTAGPGSTPPGVPVAGAGAGRAGFAQHPPGGTTPGPPGSGGASAYRQPPPGASPGGGLPAVGYQGQNPSAVNPAANPGQFTTGGSSGGYGAPGSGGYGTPGPSGGAFGAGDRTPLLIAVGVVAAALIVVLALVIRSSGDDDPRNGGTAGQGGNGYTEAIRQSFVTSCAAQEGATQSSCECVYTEVAENVPYDDFLAYDQQLAEDPTAGRPSWLDDAIQACVAGA
jgi:actin-like ATPase involved in cell morphogenesis